MKKTLQHAFLAIRLLGMLFMKPRRLLRIRDDDEICKNALQKKYGFSQLPSIDLLELIPGFDVRLANYSFLDGTSPIPDIAMLKGLAQQFRNCTYLEIGSWRGESIANVAEVAQKCYSITLSPQEMRSLKFSEDIIRLHGFFSRNLPNVVEFLHNSATFDYTQIEDKCDLVFVDGDHTYQGVRIDSANVMQLLRNDDSVVVWHDYGYSAESIRYAVLAGILDGVPRKDHAHIYHVSNTMCAILSRRRFKTKEYWQFPKAPNKNFSISVTANPIP